MKLNAKTQKNQKYQCSATLKTGYMNFESNMYLSENPYMNLTSKYVYINICKHRYTFEGSKLACIGVKTTRCKDSIGRGIVRPSVCPSVGPSVSTSQKVGKRAYPPLPTRPQLVAVYPALFTCPSFISTLPFAEIVFSEINL